MKKKDVENEMYEICSGIFYEGCLMEILRMTLSIYNRYDNKTAFGITGLTKDEAEFYEKKVTDLQGDEFRFQEVCELYEEVTGLIDIRICQG